MTNQSVNIPVDIQPQQPLQKGHVVKQLEEHFDITTRRRQNVVLAGF